MNEPKLCLAAERDAALARAEAAEAELKLWRPLTPEEAQQAFDEAEAMPMNEEEIQRIVAKVMDPAYQPPNSEQAQMAVRIKALEAEVKRLREAMRLGVFPAKEEPAFKIEGACYSDGGGMPDG